jgi:hypothetical protein
MMGSTSFWLARGGQRLFSFRTRNGLQPLIMTLPTGNLLWNVLASVCRPRSEERVFLMRDAYTRFV